MATHVRLCFILLLWLHYSNFITSWTPPSSKPLTSKQTPWLLYANMAEFNPSAVAKTASQTSPDTPGPAPQPSPDTPGPAPQPTPPRPIEPPGSHSPAPPTPSRSMPSLPPTVETPNGKGSSGELNGGQKAGIVIGTLAGDGLLCCAAIVYKKRRSNTRRARFAGEARRPML